jgi:hypothetical protein
VKLVFILKKVPAISLLSPKNKTAALFEPGSGKSELSYETAIFFD